MKYVFSVKNDSVVTETNGNGTLANGDAMVNQPSPENVKCNTPEMERKNILTKVIKVNITGY